MKVNRADKPLYPAAGTVRETSKTGEEIVFLGLTDWASGLGPRASGLANRASATGCRLPD